MERQDLPVRTIRESCRLLPPSCNPPGRAATDLQYSERRYVHRGSAPERPELAAELEKEIPEFSFRLQVKAGLTGYAQVYGKYNTTPYDKLKLDLTYIRNYSVLEDLKLIIMTPKIMLMKESTEGVKEEQEPTNGK